MTGAWTQADDSGIRRELTRSSPRSRSTPAAGVSGLAITTRQVERTGDYLDDDRASRTPPSATPSSAAAASTRSSPAPLLQRGEVLGAITVYSDRAGRVRRRRRGASSPAWPTRPPWPSPTSTSSASSSGRAPRSPAVPTQNARCARSRPGSPPSSTRPRCSSRSSTRSARLLESDGSRIDLYDPEIDALRWSYAAGPAMAVVPEWARTGGLKANQAVAGTAFAEQRPVRTDDYLADDRFVKDDARDGVRPRGRHPVGHRRPARAARPEPLGTLSVVSRQAGAYDEADMEMLAALGAQASIAITNANLMSQLATSRADISRRAEAETSLREIGARITALREPDDVLQYVVNEAFRLLRADGAVIDQFDAGEPDPPVGLRLGHQRGPARGRQAEQPAARRGRLRQGRRRGPGHHRRGLPRREPSSTTSWPTRSPKARASATSSSPRSSATPGRSAPSRSSPASRTASTRSTPRSSAAWPSRPPSPSPTPASSTSSNGRRPRWPAASRPSARCATSPPASPPCRTRTRSSTGSSRRPCACSRPTART